MVHPVGVITTEWILVAVAYIFVGLRLAVRIKLRQRHLIWSELFLVLGALSLLGLVICDTVTFRMDGMSEFVYVTEELQKIRFASNYLFDSGLYLPKLSMVAIYFQLLPQQDLPIRMAFYFVAAFTTLALFVTLFGVTFWCGTDPAINWSTNPESCTAFTSVTMMRVNWSLCFASETLLFILPFSLLKLLGKLRREEKIGLAALFGLGIITLCVSAGRFATMMLRGNNISLYILTTAEFSVSEIIVACMALRPLARRMWRSVSTQRGDTTTNRRSYRTSTTKIYITRAILQTRDTAETSHSVWGDVGSEVELSRCSESAARDVATPDSGTELRHCESIEGLEPVMRHQRSFVEADLKLTINDKLV